MWCVSYLSHSYMIQSGVQSGYAFVHFALTLEGLESAFAAAERVNNTTIDCIRYKCKTDQALLMQYLSLKSLNVSDCKPAIPSPLYTLHFSTYENSPKAERVYYSPTSCNGIQRPIDTAVMYNEATLVTRSLSSAKENDFLRSPVLVPSSSSLSSSSSSNDEYPSYRRYTTNM